MHTHNLHLWEHSHRFNIEDDHAERNTKRVILLTLVMMIIEITAGYIFGSMALLADGWHMGTHAARKTDELSVLDAKDQMMLGNLFKKIGMGVTIRN